MNPSEVLIRAGFFSHQFTVLRDGTVTIHFFHLMEKARRALDDAGFPHVGITYSPLRMRGTFYA